MNCSSLLAKCKLDTTFLLTFKQRRYNNNNENMNNKLTQTMLANRKRYSVFRGNITEGTTSGTETYKGLVSHHKWNNLSLISSHKHCTSETILCKFLIPSQSHLHEIKARCCTNSTFDKPTSESVQNKTKQNKNSHNLPLLCLYWVLSTQGERVHRHQSSCFLRKNCSAEFHWSLGKRFDNSQ